MRYIIVLGVLVMAILMARMAWSAEVIDLDVIARIESSGNPLAWNRRTDARGLFQITPVCLKHYNDANKTRVTPSDLFDAETNRMIAEWYLGWLAARLESVDDILIAYNWGIGNLRKYKAGEKSLPKETADYLVKYRKLTLTNNKR